MAAVAMKVGDRCGARGTRLRRQLDQNIGFASRLPRRLGPRAIAHVGVVQLLTLCTQGVGFALAVHTDKFVRRSMPSFPDIHGRHRSGATLGIPTPHTPLHGNPGFLHEANVLFAFAVRQGHRIGARRGVGQHFLCNDLHLVDFIFDKMRAVWHGALQPVHAQHGTIAQGDLDVLHHTADAD